jgi:hypothetical protein
VVLLVFVHEFPLGRARIAALLALLGPELDRLLTRQLPALLEQWRLTDGHHLPEGHFKALASAVVAERLEVEHLPAITDPAFLGRERWAAGPFDDVH